MLHILLARAAYQQIPARGYRDLLIYRQSCLCPALSSSSVREHRLAKSSHLRYFNHLSFTLMEMGCSQAWGSTRGAAGYECSVARASGGNEVFLLNAGFAAGRTAPSERVAQAERARRGQPRRCRRHPRFAGLRGGRAAAGSCTAPVQSCPFAHALLPVPRDTEGGGRAFAAGLPPPPGRGRPGNPDAAGPRVPSARRAGGRSAAARSPRSPSAALQAGVARRRRGGGAGEFPSGHCGKARCGRGLTWRGAGREAGRGGRRPAASRAGPGRLPACRRRRTMVSEPGPPGGSSRPLPRRNRLPPPSVPRPGRRRSPLDGRVFWVSPPGLAGGRAERGCPGSPLDPRGPGSSARSRDPGLGRGQALRGAGPGAAVPRAQSKQSRLRAA